MIRGALTPEPIMQTQKLVIELGSGVLFAILLLALSRPLCVSRISRADNV